MDTFLELAYDFDSKYLLEVSGRRDGSLDAEKTEIR
jgi:hypothetical protein